MRRRPSRLTLALLAVLCVVIAVAWLDFGGSDHQSPPAAHFPPSAPEPAPRPVSLEDEKEVAQAMTSFALSLTPETIMFGRWWSGEASGLKAGPFLWEPGVFVDLPPGTSAADENWPFAVWGRRVVVTGRPVVRHDLPVFHVSKEPLPPSEAYQAGIPVPEGTDLYKASERTVIEDAHWLPLPDKK